MVPIIPCCGPYMNVRAHANDRIIGTSGEKCYYHFINQHDSHEARERNRRKREENKKYSKEVNNLDRWFHFSTRDKVDLGNTALARKLHNQNQGRMKLEDNWNFLYCCWTPIPYDQYSVQACNATNLEGSMAAQKIKLPNPQT